ncbi:hypothetical protein NDU88_005676 [Pleurodeles waltl]|uniref:Uncharacterized protein n=1 Tax=Pleurodeles waltl TaxID=8319 RepID=A0AAV7NPQ1_PLEWA|nr:hypothetical protein NDU88_005676 [Pleurodeles waltl]
MPGLVASQGVSCVRPLPHASRPIFSSARGGTPAARSGPPTRAATLGLCPPQQGPRHPARPPFRTGPQLCFGARGNQVSAPFAFSPPLRIPEEGGGRGPARPQLGPPSTRPPQPREHEGLRSGGPPVFPVVPSWTLPLASGSREGGEGPPQTPAPARAAPLRRRAAAGLAAHRFSPLRSSQQQRRGRPQAQGPAGCSRCSQEGSFRAPSMLGTLTRVSASFQV